MSQTETTTPAFVLDPNPTVRWPVTVRIPADGGQLATFRFEARVRVYAEDDYERLLPRPPLGEDGKAEPRSARAVLAENAAALPAHIVDWFGVLDADGRAVPIDALPEQLAYGPYGMALSQGLWRAVNEVRYGLTPSGGATLGNCVPSPATGSATATPAAPTN